MTMIKKYIPRGSGVYSAIQWTGNNLKEVFDFCGSTELLNKFFNGDWAVYENYVKEHDNIFKVFYTDSFHMCAYPGDYLVTMAGHVYVYKEADFTLNFQEL